VLPATAAGIRKYLGSGLIKGIGPVMAERMVAHFGVDIMHVIEAKPGRLIEVDGLGPRRTAMIAVAWAEQKAIKEVMIFLQGVGVSTSLAVRIYKKYGDAAISVVRAEPYRLAADVWGIGFKTADTIAAAVGIARDSPERIKAGLTYTLSEAADDGHCYLPEPNLIADAAKILEVPAELIDPCLGELTEAEGVVREVVPAAAAPAAAGLGAAGPVRLAPHRRCPPSTCRLFIRPNGPWLRRCCGCLPPGGTSCRGSPPWTGTRRWGGCAGRPVPRSRRSRKRRYGWPSPCGSPS
jgi:exodeoxyribonuclease V alpha subunit